MQTGDRVKIKSSPEYGVGKVIRFYANHRTVLVQFKKKLGLKYFPYENVIKSNETKKV